MIWAGFEDGLSLSNVDTISWRMGNSNTASEVKLIIQVDGQWYASADGFSNSNTYTGGSFSSAGASADVLQELTYSTVAANWLDMTIDPGTELSIGSATASDLPASPITGIGFYVASNNTSTTVRLDTLAVTNIPEPATFALAFAATVGLLAWARRRS